jgi:paraquat-inducible protein B
LLYDNRDIAFDSIYTKTIDYRLRFTGSVQGLEAGAAVELLGNRIGRVTQTRIDIDEKNGAATSEVKIELQPERMHLIDGDSKDGSIEDRARAVLALMVKHKLRAQVASGNLLTGQKNINMDFDDDATPAAITGNGDYPEFPTAPPDDIDGLIRDAHVVLEDTDKTIREVGPAIQPLMNSLKTTSDQINTNDGHGGLSGTLYELKQAAQSMRALADYLDAHPEAILRGKKESDK